MSEELTPQEIDTIEQAKELLARISKLNLKVDNLLGPIADRAMKFDNAALQKVIHVMPSGFFRTELRTHLNNRS